MEPVAYRDIAANEERHWWFRGRRQIIDTLLRDLDLPGDAKVLELGCGTGGNLPMLAKYGRLYAAEYDEGARSMAEGRREAPVEPCNLPTEFPFGAETFDLIVMFDVLEHIEDDRKTLAVVRDHLAEHGWLAITVPAFPFLWSGHDEYNHHFRRYTKAELRSKAVEAGFAPSYLSYFNFWLFPVVAAVRAAKNLFGRMDKSGDLPLSPPAPLVNQILTQIFASERFAINRMSLPFGVSLIMSAQKALRPDTSIGVS